MNKEHIKQLVEVALSENDSLFLLSLEFLSDGKISIVIDGDNGVPLNECIRVSRAVEGNLDREEEDFSLEVSSPDVAKPLLVLRQYKKNIGRTLEVKTSESKTEGKLVEVAEDAIVLQWSAREPKPIGKGKVTVVKTATIPYDKISRSKSKANFLTSKVKWKI